MGMGDKVRPTVSDLWPNFQPSNLSLYYRMVLILLCGLFLYNSTSFSPITLQLVV